MDILDYFIIGIYVVMIFIYVDNITTEENKNARAWALLCFMWHTTYIIFYVSMMNKGHI